MLTKLTFLLCLAVLLWGCQKRVFTGKEEGRGIWMSRYEYANAQTRSSPKKTEDLVRTTFAKARDSKMNMIFFQIRGEGDAFYDSQSEPWSQMLTDTLGKDPGWDPLGFAVQEAHRDGLELHAWFNTFTLWRGSVPPRKTRPRHPFLARPDWIVCDSSGTPMNIGHPSSDYVWMSPGIPEARGYLLRIVEDIVRNYDIDGIHFDYIRYPDGAPDEGYSHDSTSVARFTSVEGNPMNLDWEDWQRQQIDTFVFDAYERITSLKPWIKISAAVIGKYDGAGWTSYFSVYQDPRAWMKAGKIDFLVPMVYWEREHPTHPFVPLITQWRDQVAYSRQIIPGLSASLHQRFGWDELFAEVEDVRSSGLPGVVFFSASGLEDAWSRLEVREFPFWAVTPSMPWKASTRPMTPQSVTVTRVAGGTVVEWLANPQDTTLNHMVYRSGSSDIDYADARAIAFVTPRGASEFIDTTISPSDQSLPYYSVSAINRLGMESLPSLPVQPAALLTSHSNPTH
jgi:uncharacterized lipoprotein YddW (UPF0748 family)